MDEQKSAEAIVAAAHSGEGPNMRSRIGSKRSMSVGDVAQKAEKPERNRTVGGGTAEDTTSVRQALAARGEQAKAETPSLIEEVLRRENVFQAYKRVVANDGAPGVDGMTVDELMAYCREHWPRIREEIRSGGYQPQPVRKVEIPKPGGGKRMLGIPTVIDRLIQQALLQVLTPIFDPSFSNWSFGFRPGRSAQGAVSWSRLHIAAGCGWVVDLDLEKFFDRVNHDILMSRMARKVKDKQVLRLIRRYLQAGLMEGGVVSPRSEGTPQGGPLSPLLSNVLLDELDQLLQKRGHRFCRYADDCNVYVKSRRAGERVMASLETFLWKRLRLKVNRTKSAVARPWHRKFLGYSVTAHRDPPRLKVAPESMKRLKEKLKLILRRGRGRRLDRVIEELNPVIRGWVAYFRMSDVRASFEVLDMWVRRKLRCILWRQWKRPRTRRAKLIARGLREEIASRSAYNGHGPWWNAGARHMNQAIPTRYLRTLGLLSFIDEHRRLACKP